MGGKLDRSKNSQGNGGSGFFGSLFGGGDKKGSLHDSN